MTWFNKQGRIRAAKETRISQRLSSIFGKDHPITIKFDEDQEIVFLMVVEDIVTRLKKLESK
jgi:hypothetical protein